VKSLFVKKEEEKEGDRGLRGVGESTGGAKYSAFDLVRPIDISASSWL
jgi:hypothetical protein